MFSYDGISDQTSWKFSITGTPNCHEKHKGEDYTCYKHTDMKTVRSDL